MTIKQAFTAARKLTVAERIQLVSEIWDSIPATQSPPVLSRAHEEELTRRLEKTKANPRRGRSWAEVEKRLKRMGRPNR